MATKEIDCKECGGGGYVTEECPTCGAEMQVDCETCEGTGKIEEEEEEEEEDD
jgi:DnaJ-class molecular chaperone